MPQLRKLLKKSKELTKRTQMMLDSIEVLNKEKKFLSKEMLASFPIEEKVDWEKAHELGNNVLGLRVESPNSIRFVLRSFINAYYTDHYHDVDEHISVEGEGKLTFHLPGNKTIVCDKDHPVMIPKGVKHSVKVDDDTQFIVDFKE